MSQLKKSRRQKRLKSGESENDVDAQLDEALEQTFPASDPVSIGHASTGARRPHERKPAPIDMERVKQLVQRLEKKRRTSK